MSLISDLFVKLAPLLSLGADAPPAGGGEGGGGQTSTLCGQGGGSILLPLLLCFVVFYFLLILPERRKQKARQSMIGAVKKGDQVITTSGILGKVMRVDERELTIQVDRDNDVRIRFLKSAIHEVVPEGTDFKDGSPVKGSTR